MIFSSDRLQLQSGQAHAGDGGEAEQAMDLVAFVELQAPSPEA